MKDTIPPPPSRFSSTALKAGAPARDYAIMMCTRGTVRWFRLARGRDCTIGRGDKCDIVIAQGTASREHAVIHDGIIPEIEDLGSLNGTIVAGRRLGPGERVRLEEGMSIQIGSVTLIAHSTAVDALTLGEDGGAGPLLPGVVLQDEKMLALYRLVEDVAASDLSVLILGETGTGKELLAQLIHDRSPRSKSAFVRLNCAALPESLAESELFGHERGAFTGADRPKPGLFEAANDGTLFLDEVGELSLAMQARLLRVLDKGEILPVGAIKAKKVAIRIVAATNRDLRSRVSTGRFRADLYYRLSGVIVNVPPLRERPNDIPALIDFFARPCADRAGKPLPMFDEGAMSALCGYRWPGNVRELKHVVERVVLLTRTGVVTASDLHLDAEDPAARAARPNGPDETGPAPRATESGVDVSLDDDEYEDIPTRVSFDKQSDAGAARSEDPAGERERIVDALARAHGNQVRAARLLGISRRTLINRLDEYGLPRPRKTFSREGG
jgi:transcriptional regulator with GAF, ATPase, and Fis domain